jgi:hypothetical protein
MVAGGQRLHGTLAAWEFRCFSVGIIYITGLVEGFSGKIFTGNHGFSHQISKFPVKIVPQTNPVTMQ